MKKFIDIGLGVTETETEFLNEIRNAINNSNKLNKLQVEKLAAKFNIFNKNYVKELTELAIVQIAREIAHSNNLTFREKYDKIVEVYYNQVNLSHRTSRSMMLQQYSTPAPIALLASNYILGDTYTSNGNAIKINELNLNHTEYEYVEINTDNKYNPPKFRLKFKLEDIKPAKHIEQTILFDHIAVMWKSSMGDSYDSTYSSDLLKIHRKYNTNLLNIKGYYYMAFENYLLEIDRDFIEKNQSLYFEPSAGNGLLTIAIPYNQVEVNEVDDIRLSNLKSQPFRKITNKDASKSFHKPNTYDGIVTNPPFGTLDEPQLFGQWKIKTLDHAMALHALNTMKDDGRAAIIIGGHTKWDEQGRIQAGKNRIFFNFLYSHYNVEDVILIDGHKLYSRQGTAFDTRLILIDGRKEKVEGAAPLKTVIGSTVVKSFDELYARIVGDDDKTEAKRLFEKRSKELIDKTLINMKLNKQNKLKLKLKLQKAKLALLGDEQISGIKDIEEINKQFNQELQQQINGTLPKGHIYKLGYPSEKLIMSGIPCNIIELTYAKLKEKSRQTNHEFSITDVKNLPRAINDPIAVFRSATRLGRYVVMTELESMEKSKYVVVIDVNRKYKKITVNNVVSLYPKTNYKMIANWIIEDLYEFVDKKQMLEFISKQKTYSPEIRKSFKHAANIIQKL